MWVLVVMLMRNNLMVVAECSFQFPLPDSDLDLDSDRDSCTMQILWERDLNLNLSQWKHVLHNAI